MTDALCAPLRYALVSNVGPENQVLIAGGQVGGSCGIFRSENAGANWSLVHSKSVSCTVVAKLAIANGVYVGVGGDGGTSACSLFYSLNGIDWSDIGCPAGAAFLQDVVYVNGQFVAVGPDGGSNSTIVTSSDGFNWTFHATGLARNLNALIFANNTYYYATDLGIYTTTDPTILATVAAGTGGDTLNWIRATDSGRVFAPSNSGNSFYSLDGSTFVGTTALMANGGSSERPFKTYPLDEGFIAIGGSLTGGGDCFFDYSFDSVNWNGGHVVDEFCTVDAPLYYLPTMMTRAGPFYFAGGYEFSSSNILDSYVARALDPLDPQGWTIQKTGTTIFADVVAK